MTFHWLSFFVGILAAAAFATAIMWAGGPDTAVAAIGVPLVVGLMGTLWFVIRQRRASSEVAA